MDTRRGHGNGEYEENDAARRGSPRCVMGAGISSKRVVDLSALPDQTLAAAPCTAGVSIQADGLARVLGNVLCFLGDAGWVRTGIVSLHGDRLRATGTDGYVAATDHAEASELHGLPASGTTLLIERLALAELYDASAATAGILRLVILESAELALRTAGGQTLVTVSTAEDTQALDYYAAVTNLMKQAEGECDAQGVAHIDAATIARFCQVRGGRPNQRAELRATGRLRPILIRIGPTFRGIFMPLG